MSAASQPSPPTGHIDDVLITAELEQRPNRAPDHELESRALCALAQEIATSPGTVLQKLATVILEIGIAESAGVSILRQDGDIAKFHWDAVAGRWAAFLGGTMPLDASPCGTVVARNTPLLFARPHEHFPAADVHPHIHEILLLPFHSHGKPVGTVWAVAHDTHRFFQAEDVRLLTSMARVASVAYQMNAALKEAERARDELERRVEERTAELMAAEAALRHAQKMEAIGQLTGGIAHDFNNMLQGIVGALEMACRRIETHRPDEAARHLASAHKATERAASLTKRLLAFARRQQLDPKPVRVDALVAGMVEMVRRTVGPNVAVELQLRAGEAQRVLCDPNALESALLNLCINARDAMPEGGRVVIGTADAQPSAVELAGCDAPLPNAYTAIWVADNGFGIEPDILERVFEPFFTTKPTGQGTGLGLSQVYGFVRQSGGVIRLESQPGQGTTVRLFLPRCEQEQTGNERTERRGAERAVAGKTLMLVDDDGSIRASATEWLRELGYHVIHAADGPSALRLLGQDDVAVVDLLITDVGLPNGMNGRQLAEVARQRIPGLPVLFITGYAGGRLPPEIEVIAKPFALDTLTRRIKLMLAARQGAGHEATPANGSESES